MQQPFGEFQPGDLLLTSEARGSVLHSKQGPLPMQFHTRSDLNPRANAGSEEQGAWPRGQGRKQSSGKVEGMLLDLPARGDFRTEAAWLFLMVFITWCELLWSKCFSGLLGDLTLESLSTKECNKIPALRSRDGPEGCLSCLYSPFADREAPKWVSDWPRVSQEDVRSGTTAQFRASMSPTTPLQTEEAEG